MPKYEIKNIWFSKIVFSQLNPFEKSIIPSFEGQIEVKQNKEYEKLYMVIVYLSTQKNDCFNIDLVLNGVFEFEFEEQDDIYSLVKKAYDSMYPYLINQVSVITNHIGMIPINIDGKRIKVSFGKKQ